MSSEDTEEEDSREKISIEEMNSPMPVASDGITFESFIRNKHDLETFKDFLERKNNKGIAFLFYLRISFIYLVIPGVCKYCYLVWIV